MRPPWAAGRATGLRDVVIDPAQAFGTGAHATTRLCLELLLALEPRRRRCVDVGCGSGVLAIAAARLGWAPVLGDRPRARVGAGRRSTTPPPTACACRRAATTSCATARPRGRRRSLANLLRPLLLRVAEDGFEGEAPRALVASGLLAGEGDEVAAAFARHGLREAERRRGGEWVALLLRR